MDKLEEIKTKFAKTIGVEKLDTDAKLKDLGLDSLDVVELLLELEDSYGIHFDDTDMGEVVTVRDFFAAVEKRLHE